MTIDTEKVPADIHTTIPGGLYRNAAGQYVDAHGNVLDPNKDEDKEKIDRWSCVLRGSGQEARGAGCQCSRSSGWSCWTSC
jgi:hypothetical protein